MISPDGNSILVRAADDRFLIYPSAGGSSKPVPGATADDEVIRWSSDRWLFLYQKGKVPARIERLDLSTGRRALVRELGPPSRAGVINVRNIAFGADERSYAYTFDRVLCRLASVSGAK